MAIGYQDVRVSKAKLERLEKVMDLAKGPKKYGPYKAWLHFANLDMWQKQGHHFHYLTGVSDRERKVLCTWGSIDEREQFNGARSLDTFCLKIVKCEYEFEGEGTWYDYSE